MGQEGPSVDEPAGESVNVSTEFTRGAEHVRRLLDDQTSDLRSLDLAGFRQWIERHLDRWRCDPVFAQRTKIRRLREMHPDVRRLEREHHRAAAADAASEHFRRLEQLERELIGANKAIAGLTKALNEAPPEKQENLQRKRSAFKNQRQRLEKEQAELVEASAERRRLLQVDGELHRLRASIGLEQSETCLRELLVERGRRGGRGGESFEASAAAVVERELVPELVSSSADEVHVLRQVTLGAARIEFDLLVVRRGDSGSEPVDVLAVVETKRNINDLGHGFRRWQANLAWLTGDASRYDPQAHRTRRFPTGHFDREALHWHAGEPFRFTRKSFRRFGRETETAAFTNRLYFITRAGPLWGVSSGALARIAHRTATRPEWELADEAHLRLLMQWAQSLAEPVESPDVLRLYLAGHRRADRILLEAPAPERKR